jgi:hypothetical protein
VSALVVSCYSTVCPGYSMPRRLCFVRRNNGFGLRPQASWSPPQYCSSAVVISLFAYVGIGVLRLTDLIETTMISHRRMTAWASSLRLSGLPSAEVTS